MLRRFRQNRVAYGVAALYALAMVLLGFAHRPIATASDPRIDLAAYVLSDGALPPICGQTGDQVPGPAAKSAHCDACALSAAPGLVLPPDQALFVPTIQTVALAGPVQGQHAPLARHAPTSRGPPLV